MESSPFFGTTRFRQMSRMSGDATSRDGLAGGLDRTGYRRRGRCDERAGPSGREPSSSPRATRSGPSGEIFPRQLEERRIFRFGNGRFENVVKILPSWGWDRSRAADFNSALFPSPVDEPPPRLNYRVKVTPERHPISPPSRSARREGRSSMVSARPAATGPVPQTCPRRRTPSRRRRFPCLPAEPAARP